MDEIEFIDSKRDGANNSSDYIPSEPDTIHPEKTETAQSFDPPADLPFDL